MRAADLHKQDGGTSLVRVLKVVDSVLSDCLGPLGLEVRVPLEVKHLSHVLRYGGCRSQYTLLGVHQVVVTCAVYSPKEPLHLAKKPSRHGRGESDSVDCLSYLLVGRVDVASRECRNGSLCGS